ncbi:phosphotransferase [Arthrobacter sp. ZXY-2]|nr:phosphotransferase [Arthrobacter sp. ZXY-2]
MNIPHGRTFTTNREEPLSLMSLGAEHGDVVVLRAEGEGADAALENLVKILETDHDA